MIIFALVYSLPLLKEVGKTKTGSSKNSNNFCKQNQTE